MEDSNILSVRNVTKSYPGVKALDDVSIDFQQAQVHALVGENGAGKSTFIKVLTGAVEPESGEIELNGSIHQGFTPYQVLELGTAAIYQEFNLIAFLSVWENVFFGREIRRGPFLCRRTMKARTAEVLASLGVEIDPDTLVKDLSVAYQQIVEIAKALVYDVKILIMDEPSAALAGNEIEHLFGLVKALRAKGVTIIYVSHKMSEVLELADRITVLRDGKLISTVDADKTNRSELVSLMVGRQLGESYPQKETVTEDVLLEVRNLNTANYLKDINFTLRKGEILGFAGLVGAGRTELARAIFGVDPLSSGEILMEGKKITVASPNHAIKHGIGLVPEDRKQQGILAQMTVKENISYSSLDSLSRFGIIDDTREQETTAQFSQQLNIKTPGLEAKVANLSGGNQQKVVLAKWLAARCRVLIFDEPTRGVDVAAKQEIYEMINELAAEGTGIIFISSEMPELIGMAERIIVMKDGASVGTVSGQEVTQEAVLHLAMGD